METLSLEGVLASPNGGRHYAKIVLNAEKLRDTWDFCDVCKPHPKCRGDLCSKCSQAQVID